MIPNMIRKHKDCGCDTFSEENSVMFKMDFGYFVLNNKYRRDIINFSVSNDFYVTNIELSPLH